MAYNTKQILRDADGNPIPQIWDEAGDQFLPYEGEVQLTGSYPQNKVVNIVSDIGTIASGSSATYQLDLLSHGFPVNSISIIGRNDSGEAITIKIRHMYILDDGSWSSTAALEGTIFSSSSAVGIKVERVTMQSHRIELIITNDGTSDMSFTSLAIMLWR